ncbi:hypothetical protein ACF0H5_005571 [Mactra antiquata]
MFEYIGINVTTVLIIVIVSLVVCLLLEWKRYSPPLPPSPSFRLPIIGHLHLLEIDSRKHLRKFRRLLGDVYSLWYGERLVIHIAGYENIREAFLKNADNFAARPHLYVLEKCHRKTDDQLVGTITDLFLGGSTVVVTTLRWSVVYLVQFPDIQEKLFNEVSKAIGKEMPSMKDKARLVYLEAFALEVMR